MRYIFKQFSLDSETFELKKQGKLVAIEPQVFLVLQFLIENRDRVITKDQLINEIWNNRCVSDASISSRIRSARKAVNDDGDTQNIIRTIYGQGFRFIADVSILNAGKDNNKKIVNIPSIELVSSEISTLETTPPRTKPSIAVLPFQFLGEKDPNNILADAVPHDLIQALSRLRWIFVIARGSAFRFRAAATNVQDVGNTLGVRYILAGAVENIGNTIAISTELSDSSTNGVIWADRFTANKDSIHQIRADIIAKVVASLEVYIPQNEARKAQLGVSENLDSWSNYHLGLQHMYRFTQENNSRATEFFNRAIEQDPGFSRAYSGLSFTSFQSAFLKYHDGQQDSVQAARRYAERSVELDPLDPFANFTMGRSYVLEGDLDNSLEWLDRAINLNPNYSQGHYSHAFADILSGNSAASRTHTDTAIALSPIDPFLYAMLAARSLSFVIDGDYQQGAVAGEKAARAPGAHFLIEMIAVIAYSLNQDKMNAQFWADNIRVQRPDASQALFFGSFPFSNPQIKQRISGALSRYGF